MLKRSRNVLFGAATSVVLALVLSACSPKDAGKAASSPDAAAKDKSATVLSVNGTTVSQRELDLLMRMQPAQREAPAARQRTLDNLTLQILASQEAAKKGLDKSPDVTDQIEMSRTTILAQAFVKDYFDNNKPTDAQLNAAYEKMKADASGNQYKARHILVKTEDEAKAIIAKLNKNPDAFGDLAKAQSLDPVSKAKGGDLGWFDIKGMVPEFGAAVSGMSKGTISQQPVKSSFGYHVIALDDIRPMADSVPPLEQVKPMLTQRVQQEELKKMLEDMKTKAKIEVKA